MILQFLCNMLDELNIEITVNYARLHATSPKPTLL